MEEWKQPTWQVRLCKDVGHRLQHRMQGRGHEKKYQIANLFRAYLGCCFLLDLVFFWLAFVGNVFTSEIFDTLLEPGLMMVGLLCMVSIGAAHILVPQLRSHLKPLSHLGLMGRWGAAYRLQAETSKRSWLWMQTMAGLFCAVHSSSFMVGAAQNGFLLYDSLTWATLACWSLLELFWWLVAMAKSGWQVPTSVKQVPSSVKASMISSFAFSFVRVVALHLHFHSIRKVEGWTEIRWPLCWLLYFVFSLLLQWLSEYLHVVARFFMEWPRHQSSDEEKQRKGQGSPFCKRLKRSCQDVGSIIRSIADMLSPSDFNSSEEANDQKISSIIEVSGAGRASRKAGLVLRQAIQVFWCLTFVGLLSVEGSCYGDYFVSGGLGAGKSRNGDYHYEGQHNNRPSYVKTGGHGSIQMSGQYWFIQNTYRGPLSQHPPEGQWMPEDCDCSDPPPLVSACESGCDYFVSGAGGQGEPCNGNYTYIEDFNDRPLYAHDSGNGARLFFQRFWKLSTREVLQESPAVNDPLNDWYYSVYTPGTSQQPPLGQWIVDGDYERSNVDPPPRVSVCEACNDADLVVTGAGGMGSNCNGNYSFYRNVSLYGNEKHVYIKNAGEIAVIWLDWDQRWKMTCRNVRLADQYSWHYAEPKKLTPPTQQWVSTNICRCSYSGVSVSVCKTCAEKSYIASGAYGPHGHANGQYDFSRFEDGKSFYEKASKDAWLEVSDSGWHLKLISDTYTYDWGNHTTYAKYFAPGSASPPTGSWEWVGSLTTESHMATVSRCHSYWPSILVLPIVGILGLVCIIYTAVRIRTLFRAVNSSCTSQLHDTSKVAPSG